MKRLATLGLALMVTLGLAACATTPPASSTGLPAAPAFAEYPPPDIPSGLTVSDTVRRRHEAAWARLQAGDPRTAAREFTAILKQDPSLYPAEVGLGFALLAGRDVEAAEPLFAAATNVDAAYLPAWVGRAEALVSLGRDADAIAALERVQALDPTRENVTTRLELLRFRLVQSALAAGQQARVAGRHADAVAAFTRALAQSPDSTMILSELARAEVAAGQLTEAETHARRAVQLEPREADWQALLGDVLEARGQLRDATAAYERADALEPSEAWRTRLRDLRERTELATLPGTFRAITTASTITRADVAAFVGIHLRDLVETAPVRATTVATDIRGHWAAAWILPVTRAGIMSVFPNHTFQPAAVVRRADLATVMSVLIPLASTTRQAELAKWRAARPRFSDLPASHVFYEAAALSAAAGVIVPDGTGRFDPTRPATGAELDEAVRRVAAIAGR
ncbi:MAG: hypothetical protein ABS36_14795 [Acidobacteria bacterium SCN 69-37]|nr:MAG: hypothetical protein ABS36_14795 [Acidobacteria bacterium SCN 69-37]